MRFRLLSILITLTACTLLALGLPLGRSMADERQQEVFLDRLGDTTRFASVAGQVNVTAVAGSGAAASEAVTGTAVLAENLRQYDRVYGSPAAVLSPSGEVLLSSRPDFPVADPQVRERVDAALRGRRSAGPEFTWPWDDRPLVVAEPVYRAGDVVAVAVTVSPTARLRATIVQGWIVIAAGSLVALALLVAGAVWLTGWALRPVRTLDAATHAIATGQLDARVTVDDGPPELRRLAAAFNEMADALTASLEQQRRFVANASHQLRNPLGALLLRVEKLGIEAPSALAEEFAEAEEEGRRLTRLLDDLLAVARLEAQSADVRRIDVVALVAARVRSWELVAQRRRIALEGFGAPASFVLADAGALGSCVDAVVDNALKFAPPGSTVRVGVRSGSAEPPDPTGAGAGEHRPRWEIVVTDEGPGLDAQELDQVGQRFWRSARHQNVSGSGLGLSIVRTLIEPYGGRLLVAPRRTGGLRVTISLPAT